MKNHFFVCVALFALIHGHSLWSDEIHDRLSSVKFEYERLSNEHGQQLQEFNDLTDYYSRMYGEPDEEWLQERRIALENSNCRDRDDFFQSALLFLRSEFPTLRISQKAWRKTIDDIFEDHSEILGKDDRRQLREKRQKKYPKRRKRPSKKLCRQENKPQRKVEKKMVVANKTKEVCFPIQQRNRLAPPVKKGFCAGKVRAPKLREQAPPKKFKENEVLLQCAVLCTELVQKF